MKKIKEKIVKIIGKNNYRFIVVKVSRILNNFHKKEIRYNNFDFTEISSKEKNVFLGYYDYHSNSDEKIRYRQFFY